MRSILAQIERPSDRFQSGGLQRAIDPERREVSGQEETPPVFERRPRVAEVAAKAGVSTATVDRVINRRGGVRERTAARVEQAIREIVDGGSARREPLRSAGPFSIFLPAESGRSTSVLGESLEAAAAARGLEVAVEFVERINPSALANRLLEEAGKGRAGIAFQGVDHPLVREAVQEVRRAHVPVVTLCSDVAGIDRLAYVGIDNRAAGRTAGFLMGRFCQGPGKLAVVWGGQLYRSHEEREMGFRAVLRHEHPDLEIIELVDGNDDSALTYTLVRKVIEKHPDLLGVYCVGGGQSGVAEALEAAGVARSVVMIGHNCNSETKPYLLSGTIDAIIHQDMMRIANAALSCLSAGSPSLPDTGIPVEIVTRENLMHR
jgi:LacI family transcriptional regulator